jgi:hypothetical protein
VTMSSSSVNETSTASATGLIRKVFIPLASIPIFDAILP